MMPVVSIVLATFRREALLCQTLGDLLALRGSQHEIIVVDQTPQHTVETQTYLDEIKDRILYMHLEMPGLVAALNQGIRICRGQILLFVDDDIRVPDPGFVLDHARNYDDPTIGGVAGRVIDAKAPQVGVFDPRSADPLWGFFHTSWDHETRCEVTTAPGTNMSFRREVIERVGGFDENLIGNAFRFENDLCLMVRKLGYRVVFDPQPTVHHYYRSAGGHENRHLLGREPASHAWYHDFFHNQVYVTLKHMPRRVLPVLLWRLYRGHVMNRPYAHEGIHFLLARHQAFVTGIGAGFRTFWRGTFKGR
jgi:GT2 family glycosyltransferase